MRHYNNNRSVAYNCDLICKKRPLLSKHLGPDFEKSTVKTYEKQFWIHVE